MADQAFQFDQRLDQDFLDSMYEGDVEHAQMIFGQFLELTPGQMAAIEEKYRQGSVEDFRQQVHKIKPVFSFVGLTDLTSLAENLEKKCREITHLSDLDTMYVFFKEQFEACYPLIRREYERLSA